MYRIRSDLVKAVIEITFDGFWTVDQVDSLANDLADHAGRIALTGRRPAILYDYTDAIIQSQEVVCALQGLVRANPVGSRRVAIFTAGQTAKLQAKRIAAADNSDRFQMFDDRQAAMTWLTA